MKLIAEATQQLSDNRGNLRRDIWAYLLEIYGTDIVEYVDFLKSIQSNMKDGKLETNGQGYYKVNHDAYRDIWENVRKDITTDKPCHKRSQSYGTAGTNPMMSQRQ